MKLAEFLQKHSWDTAAKVHELRWTEETGLVVNMKLIHSDFPRKSAVTRRVR